jgi:hypothetical protein
MADRAMVSACTASIRERNQNHQYLNYLISRERRRLFIRGGENHGLSAATNNI